MGRGSDVLAGSLIGVDTDGDYLAGQVPLERTGGPARTVCTRRRARGYWTPSACSYGVLMPGSALTCPEFAISPLLQHQQTIA